jgi:hypothetical protein
MVRAGREANKRALTAARPRSPGQLADLIVLNHLEARDVDDGYIVETPLVGEEIILVRGERQVPDALADEQILLNLMRLRR